MHQIARLLLLGLLLVPHLPPLARAEDPPATEEKGTYLGVLFCPISEALYDHLPQLPRGQGVLVTHVLPDSPASRADLRRHDLLLQYGDTPIRDCEHLVRLIQTDKSQRKVRLHLLRGGREATVEVVLGLGPKLRIAQPNPTGQRDNAEPPRAIAKPGAPPAVTVSITPLEQGKLKVAIEYFHEETGRYKGLKCEGDTEEIALEVQKLPARERQLVNYALQRIKDRTGIPSIKAQP
jgi:hypothetical protein